MATEVFSTEEIRLLDETEVELRPLPIAKLRKFSRTWSEHMKKVSTMVEETEGEFDDADVTDAQFDTFIKLCSFGLAQQLQGDKTEKQFIAYLEDVLDEHTIYKILEVTGGLKFGGDNPNQVNPANPGVGTV